MLSRLCAAMRPCLVTQHTTFLPALSTSTYLLIACDRTKFSYLAARNPTIESLTNELNVLDDKDRKINGHQTCDIEYFLDCEPFRTRLSNITTSFPKDPRTSEKWKQRWKL